MEHLPKLVGGFLKNSSKKQILIFRHGESLGNYSGTVTGWTDTKLSINGREQANALFSGLYQHIDKFDGIYSSDLARAYDTANIALGFVNSHLIKKDQRLRELHYGKEEGVHFDSLPDAEKDRINYVAPDGESWMTVRERARDFFKSLKAPGNYLVFAHAGLICTNTYEIGLPDIIGNCSCVALECDDQSIPVKLMFKWDFPPKAI